jgi:hypothetical protein
MSSEYFLSGTVVLLRGMCQERPVFVVGRGGSRDGITSQGERDFIHTGQLSGYIVE